MGYTIHPERYSLTSVQIRKRLIVVHTSEGNESDISDEQLISYMAMPGDRMVEGSDPPRRYGASYHAVADGDNAVYKVADNPAPKGCYAAAGANKDAWQICMPGKAAKTRDQWLVGRPRGQIRAVAKFIVDYGQMDGIPPTRLSAAQVAAGGRGYCGHIDISNAYHQSTHTDPGVGFPWDVLAEDISALLHPKEDEMTTVDSPKRMFDTRPNSGHPGAGQMLKAGVPVDVAVMLGGTAAAINLTAISRASKSGFVTVWKRGTAQPGTSNVNMKATDTGSAVANLAMVATDGGWVTVQASIDCDLIIDLQGYTA